MITCFDLKYWIVLFFDPTWLWSKNKGQPKKPFGKTNLRPVGIFFLIHGLLLCSTSVQAAMISIHHRLKQLRSHASDGRCRLAGRFLALSDHVLGSLHQEKFFRDPLGR